MVNLKMCESTIFKLCLKNKDKLSNISKEYGVGLSTVYDMFRRCSDRIFEEDEEQEYFHGSEYVAVGRVFEPTGEVLENGFKRRYKDYIFYDYDVEDLLKGLETKAYDEKGDLIFGRLAKHMIDGSARWYFEKGIPIATLEHIWSKDERRKLYEGKTLEVDDFWDYKKLVSYKGLAKWDDTNKEVIVSVL